MDAVGGRVTRGDILLLAARLGISVGLSYLLIRYLVNYLDPNYESLKEAKKKSRYLLKRLNISDKNIQLDNHEVRIATLLVSPSEGIDMGRILLHGPPGCGKTMIAKALARSARANFMQFDVSLFFDKWYGESQKLINAMFSLSKKIQPVIIFIDEIDSLLRSRSSQDHESSALMKAQFMALWDGFSSSEHSVIIMGATNRPVDVDEAILRRLPMRLYVPKPDEPAREDILRVILQNEHVSPTINYRNVASEAQGMSGADLKEVCRLAAIEKLKNFDLTDQPIDVHDLILEESDLINSIKKYSSCSYIDPNRQMIFEGVD